RAVAAQEGWGPGRGAAAPPRRYVPVGREGRPRRGRGAEEPPAAARVRLLLRPARGVIENRRELAEAELRRGGRRRGERYERVDRHRIDLAWQRIRRQIRVDPERGRLDVPLARVAAPAPPPRPVGG